MKQTIYFIVILLFTQGCKRSTQQSINDNISSVFTEIKSATKKHKNLWDRDLYGAILLIDTETSEIFANETDTANILQPFGNIYKGILPDNVNIANTAMDWGGKRWAMIMLPLPQDKFERIDLLAHELFHSVQPELELDVNYSENIHLDQKDARIYLRLELEAITMALKSSSEKEMYNHLTNALTFRKYRNYIFPETDIDENYLELLEGTATYTGLIISGRNNKQATNHLVNSINDFYSNPTYIRSFAYYTTPAYGYLLQNKNGGWNKEITSETNLTEYFINAFNINIPIDIKKTVDEIFDIYNGKTILQEETDREEKIQKIVADYIQKFIDLPHFELEFGQMSISFDPRNIMPLEDKGTVYQTITVIDNWGTLNVENGALMSPNWDKITITNPLKTEGNIITGEGWTLELTNDYTIEKEETTENFKLKKI